MGRGGAEQLETSGGRMVTEGSDQIATAGLEAASQPAVPLAPVVGEGDQVLLATPGKLGRGIVTCLSRWVKKAESSLPNVGCAS